MSGPPRSQVRTQRRNPPRPAREGHNSCRKAFALEIEELARRAPRFLFSVEPLNVGTDCIRPLRKKPTRTPANIFDLTRKELASSLDSHSGKDLFTSWTPSWHHAVCRARCLYEYERDKGTCLAVLDTRLLALHNPVLHGPALARFVGAAHSDTNDFLVYGTIPDRAFRARHICYALYCSDGICSLLSGGVLLSMAPQFAISEAIKLAKQFGDHYGNGFALPIAAMVVACLDFSNKDLENAIVSGFGEVDVPMAWRDDPAIVTDLTDFPQHQDAIRGRLLLKALVEAEYGESCTSISMKTVHTALPAVQPAEYIPETPDPLRQLQLPQHHIISLHHSSHNTEILYEQDGEAWHVQLAYPSGYTERFCLQRKPKLVRGKNAPAATPFEDLLRTIRTFQSHMGFSETIIANTRLRLETAWKCHSLELFQEQLNSVNADIASFQIHRLPRLPDEIVELFFDQLYDRAVAPHVNGLKAGKSESTYGEIRPSFLSKILRQLGVTRDSVYLDLGSGVGNTVMQAALETGCEAFGMEREALPHLIGAFHLQQYHSRAVLWGLYPGQVSLHFGDFLQSQLVLGLLPEVDALVINNFKFGPDTDARLYELLASALRVGAKVFTTKPLKVMGRARKQDMMFKVETFEYEEGSVSWTDSKGTYYISTKLGVGS